jgi:hypothetical protein
MKHLLIVIAIITAATAAQAADVGVSVTVGQPGFYGHIDIGNFPQPQIIYPKPVIVQPPRTKVHEEPVYLHVPPGHAKKWKKHCHKYNACGKHVYFVQEKWYNDVYVPQYQERKSRHGRDYDQGHRGDRGYDRDRGHDRDYDKDRGQGRGKGHGKD